MANTNQQSLDVDPDLEPVLPSRVPVGYDRGTCKGCSAAIFWALALDGLGMPKINQRTGAQTRWPISPRPRESGNIICVGDSRARVITAGEHVHPAERYVLHFKDCAAADRFSKGRGGAR